MELRIISSMQSVFFYAHKDIMKNKNVFLFITIAIAFATANIIIINGFMDGFSNDLVDSAIESSTGHLNIYPKEGDRFIDGLGIKEKKLSSINGIIAYSP